MLHSVKWRICGEFYILLVFILICSSIIVCSALFCKDTASNKSAIFYPTLSRVFLGTFFNAKPRLSWNIQWSFQLSKNKYIELNYLRPALVWNISSAYSCFLSRGDLRLDDSHPIVVNAHAVVTLEGNHSPTWGRWRSRIQLQFRISIMGIFMSAHWPISTGEVT